MSRGAHNLTHLTRPACSACSACSGERKPGVPTTTLSEVSSVLSAAVGSRLVNGPRAQLGASMSIVGGSSVSVTAALLGVPFSRAR